MAYYAQGSTVTFDGTPIGSVLNWTTTPATAGVQDSTNYDSTVTGSGWDSRVLKSFNCTAIEPGTASATMLSVPGWSWSDVGHKGTLEISFAAATLSFEAILKKFEVQGAVGDLIKVSVEFQYTGS